MNYVIPAKNVFETDFKNIKYLVRKVSIQVNKDMDAVTPAEEKNDGMEWRGNANISAKSHRYYLRFSGSNTWEKTEWINYLSIKVTVKKQNGRWIVKSSDSLLAEGKIMGIQIFIVFAASHRENR